MLPIAVDAMGGDNAPDAIVDGARAAVEAGTEIILVGTPDLAERVDTSGFEIVECSEVIEMEEDGGRAVRRKKDSTLVRAAELVRDGRAAAMVSAGNTGATMASALLRMGRISGVKRPAIATPIPAPGGNPTVLLDAGANADVSADLLVQFALMGSVLSHHRFGIDSPTVGLLSIGEEPGKGDQLRKEAFALLEEVSREDGSGDLINFIGNIEGRDLMTDAADVAVTDGFTGNVALKTLEGALRSIVGALLEAFGSTEEYQAHADALMPAFIPLYQTLDPEGYGGAVLLGVDGVCIISHGSSSPRAITNAIRLGKEMAEADLVGGIRAAVKSS